jgi:uncharacterized metal-binding protein YceD (DUF177 family)
MTPATDADDVDDADDVERMAAAAEPVLAQAGVTRPFRLEPITGGGNNRVFRVESGGAPVVLKVYFRHPDDPRDRLRADFGFSAFAWGVGARSLPQPLASDRETGVAVYEFVAGQKLAPGEVTAAHVEEAAAFVRSINEHRADPRASALPQASEACFSIADHLACVSRRLDRLRGIDVGSPIGRDAEMIVDRRMRPAWERVAADVRASAHGGVDGQLDAGDRCLSPSDFGFHNAIRAADRRLRFVDGEDEAARLDEDSDDDVLALPASLDVPALIEDELILALPLVPRHEVCPQPLPMSAADEGAEDEAPHAFAALAHLRRPGSVN